MTIKEELKKLGKTQVWLIQELRKEGVNITPPYLSIVINGVINTPSADRVKSACYAILAREKQNA